MYVGRGNGSSLFTRGSPEYGLPESRIASYSAQVNEKLRFDALALTAAMPFADASDVVCGPVPYGFEFACTTSTRPLGRARVRAPLVLASPAVDGLFASAATSVQARRGRLSDMRCTQTREVLLRYAELSYYRYSRLLYSHHQESHHESLPEAADGGHRAAPPLPANGEPSRRRGEYVYVYVRRRTVRM